MWNRKERRRASTRGRGETGRPDGLRTQRNGFTKIVGVHCLNCETTIPVGEGFVIWPVSSAAGGAL